MIDFARRLFARPIRIWNAGGWVMKLVAAYLVISPIIVWSLASGKLLGGVQVPWWVVSFLFVIGHINSLGIAPTLVWYHDRKLHGPMEVPPWTIRLFRGIVLPRFIEADHHGGRMQWRTVAFVIQFVISLAFISGEMLSKQLDRLTALGALSGALFAIAICLTLMFPRVRTRIRTLHFTHSIRNVGSLLFMIVSVIGVMNADFVIALSGIIALCALWSVEELLFPRPERDRGTGSGTPRPVVPRGRSRTNTS